MSLTTTPTMDTHPNPSIFRELVRIQIRRFFENMATHYTHYASKRVDFSRPASTKTMGYELWQKKKSTVDLLAYQRRGRRKGSRGTTSPHGETSVSGTASPPASTERDVVVEPALKLAARSHRKDPHTGRLGHSRCRRPIMLTVREAIGMLSPPHIEPSPDLPFAARRTHHACGRTNAGNAAVARQPSAGSPRTTRLTNRASYGPQA
jgi:hypothetical protein